MKRPTASAGLRERGRTMIELMVALTIGVVVVGATLATVVGTGQSARLQDGQGRLAEEAQVALNFLTSQLRMAGYSPPRVNGIPGANFANYDGPAVRGCSNGFADTSVADLPSLVCVGGVGADVISVVYEADATNTLPTALNEPTDCRGDALPPLASPLGGNFFLTENRFFVRNNPTSGRPELACAGSGDGFVATQGLVANVEAMQLTYGIRGTVVDPWGNTVFDGRTIRYLRADEIDATFAAEPLLLRWSRVNSVRVCLTVRSGEEVADVPVAYVDCDGNVVTPPDRRMRVVVSATTNLRNASAVAP